MDSPSNSDHSIPALTCNLSETNLMDKVKAKRKRITPEQLHELMHMFEQTDTPSFEVREKLANELHMTNREVQVWFQNRRAKLNRQKVEANKLFNKGYHSINNHNIRTVYNSSDNLIIPRYGSNTDLRDSGAGFSTRSIKRGVPAPIKVTPYPQEQGTDLHSYVNRHPHTAPNYYPTQSPGTPIHYITSMLNHNLNLRKNVQPSPLYPQSATLPTSDYYSIKLPAIHNYEAQNNFDNFPTNNEMPKRTSAPSALPSIRELGLPCPISPNQHLDRKVSTPNLKVKNSSSENHLAAYHHSYQTQSQSQLNKSKLSPFQPRRASTPVASPLWRPY